MGTARDLIPPVPTWPKLREAAAQCQACPLWKLGKQTVFGAGAAGARLMLVGEQPGFQEDIAGRPFVGPAGRLLDSCLAAAGIVRRDLYVTNVVKHFKWRLAGKRHMHETPSAAEVQACFPWLEAEIAVIKPQWIVCLGATAAKALLGKGFRVTRQRGEFFDWRFGTRVMATVHPSSLLRAPDELTRQRETDRFIADLKKVAAVLVNPV